jgi:NAD(P)H-quinone oxidoreductase subunit 5
VLRKRFMSTHSLITVFIFDTLTTIMIALVAFIGCIVGMYASRYMQGDKRYFAFFGLLSLLIVSVMLMVAFDQLILLLIWWGISNFLLVRLMIHKPQWKAAKNSGWLAARVFAIGFFFLACGFMLLYVTTRQSSIQSILHSFDPNNPLSTLALVFILLAAMSQSAIWPFHRWLLSSLNSPTPVSAIMHAGLVNGGGFLLARFAPLYFLNPKLLTIIFIIGIVTALIGTLWKLIQNDVKRMLACSTMAQMGFMFAQCGLGLFPAAVAHLVWHGLFKANLFLASPGAGIEKRLTTEYPSRFISVILALLCGALGAGIFSMVNHQFGLVPDTTFVLLGVWFIAVTQFALTSLIYPSWEKILITVLLTSFISALYGLSVRMMESIFASTHLMHPQPLNAFYLIGLMGLLIIWLIMLFKDKLINQNHLPRVLLMLYVKALNASQPHPTTITTNRNQYRYE